MEVLEVEWKSNGNFRSTSIQLQNNEVNPPPLVRGASEVPAEGPAKGALRPAGGTFSRDLASPELDSSLVWTVSPRQCWGQGR